MTSLLQKHLLVDGYNIIHAWPHLKKILTQFGPEPARTQLAQILQVIHDTENIRLTIVFDGQGRKPQIQRPSPDPTFSLLFSPSGISADIIIEKLVSSRKKNQEIIVATQDNLIRDAVLSSGATLISPENLEDWVNACQNRQNKNIMDHQKLSQKSWKLHNPWDALPPPSEKKNSKDSTAP